MKAIIAAALLAALPQTSLAWTARNGLDVQPTGRPGEIVVEFDASLDVTDFWCAAGDYVVRGMGLPSKTRLYRSNTPRERGQGYMFTINKDDATPTSGLSTFGKDRDDTSIGAGVASAMFYRPLLFITDF